MPFLFDIRVDIMARFTAFVTVSFSAVLLLATVIDPDLFIHLETPHRPVFFYLSVFGAVLTVARDMIDDPQREVSV